MKIGILTASRTNNNGTDLQALAMQLIFSEAGAETEVIDYRCKQLENSGKIIPKVSVKNFLKIHLNVFKKASHYSFRKKYFKYSKKVYNDANIKEIEYDRVVVGSDQIWNLDITGNDLNFFLPFKYEKVEKYSYAASIGKTDILEWEKKYEISGMLKEFKSVSVREESGVKALEVIGVKARCDLDPLLMISRDIWKNYAKKISSRKPFILLYLVENNLKAKEWAKEYAKKNNADVLMVDFGIRNHKGIKSIRFCSIEKWLGLVEEAMCIVTNSYHGLSMAINLKTEVVLVELQNSVQSNARMLNLAKRLEIEQCVMKDELKTELNKIDWKKTQEKINAMKDESLKYIKAICTK